MVRIHSVIQETYAAAMPESIALRGPEVGRYNHCPITDVIEAHDPETAGIKKEKYTVHQGGQHRGKAARAQNHAAHGAARYGFAHLYRGACCLW